MLFIPTSSFFLFFLLPPSSFKSSSGKRRERERFMTRGAFSDGPTGSSVRLGGRISFFFFSLLIFYTRLHTFRLRRRRRPFIILNQNFVSQNGRRKTNKQKIDNVDALKRRSAGVSDVSISLKLFLLVKRRRRWWKKNQWLCCAQIVCVPQTASSIELQHHARI